MAQPERVLAVQSSEQRIGSAEQAPSRASPDDIRSRTRRGHACVRARKWRMHSRAARRVSARTEPARRPLSRWVWTLQEGAGGGGVPFPEWVFNGDLGAVSYDAGLLQHVRTHLAASALDVDAQDAEG